MNSRDLNEFAFHESRPSSITRCSRQYDNFSCFSTYRKTLAESRPSHSRCPYRSFDDMLFQMTSFLPPQPPSSAPVLTVDSDTHQSTRAVVSTREPALPVDDNFPLFPSIRTGVGRYRRANYYGRHLPANRRRRRSRTLLRDKNSFGTPRDEGASVGEMLIGCERSIATSSSDGLRHDDC